MAIIRSSKLAGVVNGVLTTTTAGSGDTVFSSIVGSHTVTDSWITTPSTASAATYSWESLSLTDWCVRLYVRVEVGATFASVPFAIANNGSMDVWRVGITSSQQFVLRDSANAGQSWSATLSTGVEYCISLYGDATGDAVVWGIDRVSDGAVFMTSKSVSAIHSGGTNFSSIRFGRGASTAAGPISLAHHTVGNSQLLLGVDTSGPTVALAQSDNITVADVRASVAAGGGALSYDISPLSGVYQPISGVFYINQTTATQSYIITVNEAGGASTTKTIIIPPAQATRRRAFTGSVWV